MNENSEAKNGPCGRGSIGGDDNRNELSTCTDAHTDKVERFVA